MSGAATRVAVLAALLATVLGMGAAAADPSLTVGEPQSGVLGQGNVQPFSIVLNKGDFVRGTLQVQTGTLDLELTDGTSSPPRRLNSGVTGRGGFLFTADRDGPVALRVRASEADSRFTLAIDQLVPLARQAAPVVRPLSPAIAALADEIGKGGDTQAATAAFWRSVAVAGTPLIEPATPGKAILTFLWRSAEQRNVRLLGAPSSDHDDLLRLGASDVWYRSYEVPSSTRLSYQLAPDVPLVPGTAHDRRRAILATAQADPLNRHPWPADEADRFSRKSLAVLADAPPQDALVPRDVPKGRVESFRFASAALGNERTVSIYYPPGHAAGTPAQAMLVLFDGTAYRTKAPTPTILDNLIAAKRIPPTLAVFIDNPDGAARARELPPNPVFADVLAGDLMAAVRERTHAIVPAARTILAGSSFGGLASAYVASRHPEVFGGVLSQSGSFWWHPENGDPTQPEYMAEIFLAKPRLPIRFYIEAGLFETGRVQAGILDTSRHLRDVLKAKGYEVTYREHAAGHDFASWRGTLVDGLIALLGSSAAP